MARCQNYGTSVGNIKYSVAYTMCCFSIFNSTMTMILNFCIAFIFSNFFMKLFGKCNIMFDLDVILILFLLKVTFFHFKISHIFCLLFVRLAKFFHTIFSAIQTMLIYIIKCPSSLYWIFTRNMFSYFCCWIFFWVIFTVIYFFNEMLNVRINYIPYFMQFHVLIKF